MVAPSRGEIWWYDPDPTRGREQARLRPGLIVSRTSFNQGPYDLIIAIPMTRTRRDFPFWVEASPEQSGLRETSFIMCEQIRSVSAVRLLNNYPVGRVTPEIMALVEDRLSILLGFDP